jgi:DNA invertase Pin-like site-specific DNA recombinase
MKNVIGYVRVSTDGQVGEDKFGMAAQKEQIEEYCEAHDMQIVKWVHDEGESGAEFRPGMDEICYNDETYTNPPFEAVVVAKSDRVARDINVYYYYKMVLRKKDIDLISVAEDFGQFGAFSNMLEAFTICIAEMERNSITYRMTGGRKQKAKTGGYAGGRVPYGYSAVNGKLEINEEEAEVVRKIFEMNKKEYSYRAILKSLKDEGIVTRKGKDFVISTIQSILGNENLYCGMYRYGKDGEWIKGQQEAILWK